MYVIHACVHMYTYEINICIHNCKSIYVYILTHINMCTYIFIYRYTWVYLYKYMCISSNVCIHIRMYVFTKPSIHTHTYIHTYIYIYFFFFFFLWMIFMIRYSSLLVSFHMLGSKWWRKYPIFTQVHSTISLKKTSPKKNKTNSSPEDNLRHGWKHLGKYGTFSPLFGSQHTKRNKKTWTSKHKDHSKKYSMVYKKTCLNNNLLPKYTIIYLPSQLGL